MPGIITEREYTVHYYEIDSKKDAMLITVMNYFYDLAILQSEMLGIGVEHLTDNHIFWVLYKWDININKFPKLYEKVKVRTWSYSIKKFYAYRQFEIVNSAGEILVSANTLWFLMSTETRKPIRIPDYIPETYKTPKDPEKELEIEKLFMPENIQFEKTFHVRYNDIDTNNHVNNVTYVDWALETVPLEISSEYSLKKVAVVYEKETGHGESIKSVSEKNINGSEIIFTHAILKENGEKLTLVKSVWLKK
jgi:medium-chain acyl-[acyl-carrier-protein] hydrolase